MEKKDVDGCIRKRSFTIRSTEGQRFPSGICLNNLDFWRSANVIERLYMFQGKHHKSKQISKILAFLFTVFSTAFVCLMFMNPEHQPSETVDRIQTEYIKPEAAVDRAKVVSLSGWSEMNVKSGTKELSVGSCLNNPQTNLFYEDIISVDGKDVESLTVDSGEKVKINHLLELAGIKSSVVSAGPCDSTAFNLTGSNSSLSLEAVGIFDGKQTVSIQTDDGMQHLISAECRQNYYYLKYSIYIGRADDMEDAELLYESGLIEPGKCIQDIEISRPLDAGTYDAFAFIQPYASDQKTKLNSGTVTFKLKAE